MRVFGRSFSRGEVGEAVLLVLLMVGVVLGMSGCSAGYQRGVFAGQASQGIKAETAKLAEHDAEGWARLKAIEWRNLSDGYAQGMEDARALSVPADAANTANTVTLKWFGDKAEWKGSVEEEGAKADSYVKALNIYAQSPIDVSTMADNEQKMAIDVGKHAVAGAIDIGTQIAAKAKTKAAEPQPTPTATPAATDSTSQRAHR